MPTVEEKGHCVGYQLKQWETGSALLLIERLQLLRDIRLLRDPSVHQPHLHHNPHPQPERAGERLHLLATVEWIEMIRLN
jgi:hypothetical protein